MESLNVILVWIFLNDFESSKGTAMSLIAYQQMNWVLSFFLSIHHLAWAWGPPQQATFEFGNQGYKRTLRSPALPCAANFYDLPLSIPIIGKIDDSFFEFSMLLILMPTDNPLFSTMVTRPFRRGSKSLSWLPFHGALIKSLEDRGDFVCALFEIACNLLKAFQVCRSARKHQCTGSKAHINTQWQAHVLK